MKHLGYCEFIMNKIADIPYGQPFQTDIIAESMAEKYTIPIQKTKPITNITLKRLADKGQLERFQKGVYYRARQTVFGKAHPSAEALEAQLLIRRGMTLSATKRAFP